MCTLIARGDLTSTAAMVTPFADSVDLCSVKSEGVKMEVMVCSGDRKFIHFDTGISSKGFTAIMCCLLVP